MEKIYFAYSEPGSTDEFRVNVLGDPAAHSGAPLAEVEESEALSQELRAELDNIRQGLSAKESSERLGVSVSVVENSRAALLREYQALNLPHLIRQVTFREQGQLPLSSYMGTKLTKGELEILQYLSFGFTIQEIARVLTHGNRSYLLKLAEAEITIERVLKKLEVQTEAQAVDVGYREGYLGSEDPVFIANKETLRVSMVKVDDNEERL